MTAIFRMITLLVSYRLFDGAKGMHRKLLALGISMALLGVSLTASADWSVVGAQVKLSRMYHTATRLADGRVLVTGGKVGQNANTASAVDTAEIYDPVNGDWTILGGPAMSSIRQHHTATLLRSGKVLIVGGDDNVRSIQTADIFDPSTPTMPFPIRGIALRTARSDHTATLLLDGTVLITGGRVRSSGVDANTASAEIFDPATNSFAPVAAMGETRSRHAATLLPNGEVLVTGGISPYGTNLTTSEIYNPTSQTWRSYGSFTIGRKEHTANLLPSGNVVLLGGCNQSCDAEVTTWPSGAWQTITGKTRIAIRNGHTTNLMPDGTLLVNGGGGDASFNYEIVNPNTFSSGGVNTFPTPMGWGHTTTMLRDGKVLAVGGQGGFTYPSMYKPALARSSGFANPLHTPRDSHTATLLPNGMVLAAGGFGTQPLRSTEIFNPDPAVHAWSLGHDMAEARYSHTATLLASGKVLVAGGAAGSSYSPIASAETYNYVTNTWTTVGSLSTARMYHAATLLPDGRVVVTGGMDVQGHPLGSAEVFDPNTGVWSNYGGNNATARYKHTATFLGRVNNDADKLIIAGGVGANGVVLDSVETMGLADTSLWTPAPKLLSARYAHTVTILPSRKLAVYFGSGPRPGTSEVYDPNGDSSLFYDNFAHGRSGHTATMLPDRSILLVGGTASLGGNSTTAELWSPFDSTGATFMLYTPRQFHTATLLLNGQVLVAGGNNGSAVDSTELIDAGMPTSTSGHGPTLSSATPVFYGPQGFTANGSGFITNEGSGGTTNSSPSNYPMFQVMRLDNEMVEWVNTTDYMYGNGNLTDTSFHTGNQPLYTGTDGLSSVQFGAGPVRITAFVNGVKSNSFLSTFVGPPLPPTISRVVATATGVDIYFMPSSPPEVLGYTGQTAQIQNYSANCQDETGATSVSADSTVSPVRFTGLTKGLKYWCSVYANSWAGLSGQSAQIISNKKVGQTTDLTPILMLLLD